MSLESSVGWSATNVGRTSVRAGNIFFRGQPRAARAPHRLSHERGQSLPRLRPLAMVYRTDQRRMRILRGRRAACRSKTRRRRSSGSTATSRPRIAASTADQRRHPRLPAKGRKLKLLIDGSPSSFALHNISEGGAMGNGASNLSPGTNVYVRFEGGILVPAVVKWTENGLIGLAFDAPIMLDRSAQPAN